MPTCNNCGEFVTEAYVRVFTPEGHEGPRVCPSCEDMIRDGAQVREARSSRT
jgi:NAD-dependent SIR2 family protein deacetylase